MRKSPLKRLNVFIRAKRVELRRKEDAGRETERIMRAKRAEFRRKEVAARESQEAEEIAKAVSLEKTPSYDETHQEETSPITIEKTPSSDAEYQENVTVPAQNVPVQNASPQKTSIISIIITIVKKIWGKVCEDVRSVDLFVQSVVRSVALHVQKGVCFVALLVWQLVRPVVLPVWKVVRPVVLPVWRLVCFVLWVVYSLWKLVYSVWKLARFCVDLVINFMKNFVAVVFIAQVVLFIADKFNLVSPKYQSVLTLTREILDIIK